MSPQARQEAESELRTAQESRALLEREKEEQATERDEEVCPQLRGVKKSGLGVLVAREVEG